MNPILKKQFATVKKQLKELTKVLDSNQIEIQKQHEEKSTLKQHKLRDLKQMTTLKRIEKDYDALEDENIQYQEERTEIRDSLNSIVELSKALHRMQKP